MKLRLIETNAPFDLSKVADEAYRELKQTDDLAIELSFVDEDEIQRLNREYRNIDRVTDVLSFPYLDGIRYKTIKVEDYPEDAENGELLLGSVCVCTEVAKRQAEEYGHSFEREVAFLTLHGILHCFGYDHISEADEKEMNGIAEKIMNTLSIKR